MLIPRKLSAYVEHHEGDEVRLTVPATVDAVRIARVGAAGLGTRLGFSFSEVEELRLAVGEAAALLCDDHLDQMLDIRYDIQPDGLRVTLALTNTSDNSQVTLPDVSDLATSVLNTVVNAWEVDGSGTQIRLYKTPGDSGRRNGE